MDLGYSRTIDRNLELKGSAVVAVMQCFGAFSLLASRVLHDVGIGKLDVAGMLQVDEAGWYPAVAFLRACSRIERELGSTVVYQAGLAISRFVPAGPAPEDLEATLHSVDTAYHATHRRNGETLLDPVTGKMREGIGHYRARRVADRHLVVECENPYPCELDRGIVEGLARRCQSAARVAHDPKVRCRKQGGDACHFIVQW